MYGLWMFRYRLQSADESAPHAAFSCSIDMFAKLQRGREERRQGRRKGGRRKEEGEKEKER